MLCKTGLVILPHCSILNHVSTSSLCHTMVWPDPITMVTILDCTLSYHTLPYSTLLYSTLPWLYQFLHQCISFYSILPWLYPIPTYSTTLYYMTLLHSTWLYLTIIHAPMALPDSTAFYFTPLYHRCIPDSTGFYISLHCSILPLPSCTQLCFNLSYGSAWLYRILLYSTWF